MREVLGIDLVDHYYKYLMSSELSFVYPLKYFCVVSQRLESVSTNENGLNKDGGPALTYKDGTTIWALNGVRVPREVVEASADSLNVTLVMSEKNAEIRREIVRKIGIDRVVKELKAKRLDGSGSYELLSLTLGENMTRPYLKMVNPSTGDIHLEGVHPDCKTVEQAMNWRNGFVSDDEGAFELVTLT